MVDIRGTVYYVSPARVSGDKRCLTLIIEQRIEGYKPTQIEIDVWSDSKVYDDALRLTEGLEIEAKCNLAVARDRSKNLTNKIKYYPISICSIL
jgi:hypothetical protein